MKIGTKERLQTIVTLAVIGLIAVMIWWTYREVGVANRQYHEASAIARVLSQIRLLTFEYRLYHNARSKAQWYELSDRVADLIANAQASGGTQDQVLTRMRGRTATVRRLFIELAPRDAEHRVEAPLDELTQQYEALMHSRMLVEQQDNFTDAFLLSDLATERINEAQRRLLVTILSGLTLIAMTKIGVSWMIRRDVLDPVARLQHAAQQVTAGNGNFDFEPHGKDEISELSNSFHAMTTSLRESVAQVERSNQELAALNQELEAFSYSVSHDLRGPLRSVDGFALVLLEDYADKLDDEGRNSLERIRAASQRMGDLIDDLLRLSQVSRTELNITAVDLSAIAREIADVLDREPSGRSVEWAIESGLSVRADPALMRIAMQNLLQNAWKFTGKTDRPLIRVGATKRDARTVYFVADNGVGFDMAYAGKLFGAFQRMHHVGDFPGTGIGLAIVRRIINRHNWEIWAEAKEGEGATFFFRTKEPEHGTSEQDHPAG